MRSMRGGFIFRNQGPSLKVHHGFRIGKHMGDSDRSSEARMNRHSSAEPLCLAFCSSGFFSLKQPHADPGGSLWLGMRVCSTNIPFARAPSYAK